ncbi:hypothetical protein DW322_11575 [Rhodococcus rhodnii]|uniref:Uncharacterized protein n=2 Tax=Rhodococcus rhodnii TaxID=38312 RepID=R7WLU7_9NOCA|nr:hypothetical protein [Rhodococcus rhodnii]EOM76267.1 hypothetical protein Rrhod_2367 [Rhodococcus rhodnii LMG 5362]TXG90744.1 hypothetical protein DW322_11575 [Rhodococcus rhodnii]
MPEDATWSPFVLSLVAFVALAALGAVAISALRGRFLSHEDKAARFARRFDGEDWAFVPILRTGLDPTVMAQIAASYGYVFAANHFAVGGPSYHAFARVLAPPNTGRELRLDDELRLHVMEQFDSGRTRLEFVNRTFAALPIVAIARLANERGLLFVSAEVLPYGGLAVSFAPATAMPQLPIPVGFWTGKR